jgi:hypothetical protein
MIVSTYQPYFAPFPAFFTKALRSDVFILMDSVQFPRGMTWLTRNRFKHQQGILRMTIPVWKKGLGLQRINEVKICYDGTWPGKHLTSLITAYAKAPFFEDHVEFLEKIFSGKFDRLIDLNVMIIKRIMEYMQISTRLLLLSDLGIEEKEPLLTMEICKKLEASRFLTYKSAEKYLNPDAFQKAGIELTFIKPPSPVYPQLWGQFIPNLSIFDLLFNCGPKARDILTKA